MAMAPAAIPAIVITTIQIRRLAGSLIGLPLGATYPQVAGGPTNPILSARFEHCRHPTDIYHPVPRERNPVETQFFRSESEDYRCLPRFLLMIAAKIMRNASRRTT